MCTKGTSVARIRHQAMYLLKTYSHCLKIVQKVAFSKPEDCGEPVLLVRSLLIEQRLVENAKIDKFKCDILSDF